MSKTNNTSQILNIQRSVSFLGCGWLGLPSAKKMHSIDFNVKVSTTTSTKIELLKSENLIPFLINISPEINDIEAVKTFLECDTLVINIPPGKASATDFHPTQIKNLLPFIEASNINHVIYVSATSVYHELNQIAYETDVNNASEATNQKLAQAEDFIKTLKNKQVTILRYGGLVGGSRNLLKYFAGKKELEGGNIPVNLIHQHDAVNILCEVIAKQLVGTYNVCAPLHPTKKEFYSNLAQKHKAIAPEFIENSNAKFKIINTEKITNALNYPFEFENPLDFEYDC